MEDKSPTLKKQQSLTVDRKDLQDQIPESERSEISESGEEGQAIQEIDLQPKNEGPDNDPAKNQAVESAIEDVKLEIEPEQTKEESKLVVQPKEAESQDQPRQSVSEQPLFNPNSKIDEGVDNQFAKMIDEILQEKGENASIGQVIKEQFNVDTSHYEKDEKDQADNFLSKRLMRQARDQSRVTKPKLQEDNADQDKLNEFSVCGTSTGRFNLCKGKDVHKEETELVKVLGVGAEIYFKQLKNLIVFLILATLLSLPAYLLFTSGKPETGRELQQEQSSYEVVIASMSFGNIGNNEGHPYEISMRKTSTNLELYCDAGTIAEIMHYELVYDRVSDPAISEDSNYCQMESLPENFQKQYYDRCINKLSCKVQLAVDQDYITKCKQQLMAENPALTEETLKKTRLEFMHHCDNIRVDTLLGEMHRRTLSNIVIMCDFIVCVLFILNSVYMAKRINDESSYLDQKFAQITDYTVKVENLPDLPADELRAKLTHHLEKVVADQRPVTQNQFWPEKLKEGANIAKIANVGLAMKSFGHYEVLLKIDYLVRKGKRRYMRFRNAIHQLETSKDEKEKKAAQAQKDDVKPSMEEVIRDLIIEVKNLKKKLDENEKDKKVALAYVTFRSMEGQLRCKQAYNASKFARCIIEKCNCVTKERYESTKAKRFEGKWLQVTEAVDPQIIKWENQGHSYWNRSGRYVLASLVVVAALLVSTLVIAIVKTWSDDNTLKPVTCDPNTKISPAIAFKTQVLLQDEIGTGYSDQMYCFCYRTMWDNLRKTGSFMSQMKREFEDGRAYCDEWIGDYAWSNAIIVVAPIVLSVSNWIAKKLLEFMTQFYGFHNEDEQLKIEIRNKFFISFLNIGIVTQLVFFNAFGIKNSKATDITTFSSEWYTLVGTTIVISVLLLTITPNASALGTAAWNSFCRLRDRKWKSDAKNTKKLTQEDYNKKYEGDQFSFLERYANLLTVLGLALFYSSGLPIMYPIACLFFITTYWVDKFLLLKCSKKPRKYDKSLALHAVSFFKWIIFAHAVGLIILYGITKITDQNHILEDVEEEINDAFIRNYDPENYQVAEVDTPAKVTISSGFQISLPTDKKTQTRRLRPAEKAAIPDWFSLKQPSAKRHLQEGPVANYFQVYPNIEGPLSSSDSFNDCVNDDACWPNPEVYVTNLISDNFGPQAGQDFTDMCAQADGCKDDFFNFWEVQIISVYGDPSNIDHDRYDQILMENFINQNQYILTEKIFNYEVLNQCLQDSACYPNPRQHVQGLMQNDLGATLTKEFTSLCDADDVCSYDFFEFWAQHTAQDYYINYDLLDQMRSDGNGGYSIANVDDEFDQVMDYIFNVDQFNWCVQDAVCPSEMLVWALDYTIGSPYESKMIQEVQNCEQDPLCSSEFMEYWFQQLSPEDQAQVDMNAYNALRARGYESMNYEYYLDDSDPFEFSGEVSDIQAWFFTFARYDACVQDVQCSQNPLDYWNRTLPYEKENNFADYEIQELLDGCKTEEWCSQDPLNALYEYAWMIESGVGTGQTIVESGKVEITAEDVFLTWSNYDECVASDSCRQDPLSYFRTKYANTPYSDELDGQFRDFEEEQMSAEEFLRLFKEELEWREMEGSLFEDESLIYEELAAEYGTSFNASATTYTDASGTTQSFNASYYKDWYTDGTTDVKTQSATELAEYTAINEDFDLTAYQQQYIAQEEEESVNSIYMGYYFFLIATFVVFGIYVCGIKPCIRLYQSTCKTKNADEEKGEEQSNLDFFDAVSFKDLTTLKTHIEEMKNEVKKLPAYDEATKRGIDEDTRKKMLDSLDIRMRGIEQGFVTKHNELVKKKDKNVEKKEVSSYTDELFTNLETIDKGNPILQSENMTGDLFSYDYRDNPEYKSLEQLQSQFSVVDFAKGENEGWFAQKWKTVKRLICPMFCCSCGKNCCRYNLKNKGKK